MNNTQTYCVFVKAFKFITFRIFVQTSSFQHINKRLKKIEKIHNKKNIAGEILMISEHRYLHMHVFQSYYIILVIRKNP
jgi:hypothetical protein